MDDKKLKEILWDLVMEDKIECGINEEGEVVYWMTEEQRESYFDDLEGEA